MRLATLIIALCTSGACACTIPVFRYALDRWEADKFHLVLPQDVAKDPEIQDLLRPLRANGKANLDFITATDAAQRDTVLRNSRESDKPVWSGKLDATSLAAVLDSPARKKLVQQLLAGDSVIWVIADSGSPVDVLEVERVEKRLKFLEQVASLPIQDPNDPDSQLGPGPPLRLKFATLRLRRDDPAEQLLLRMLVGPRGDFDPATTSFASAVFGRGRVLGAWPLAILDDASLEDACMFLVGRCGCRLKNENPGWDILLNLDWEKALPAVKTSDSTETSVSKPANVETIGPPPSQLRATIEPIAGPDVLKIIPDEPEIPANGRKGPLLAGVAAGLVLLFLIPRWLRK
ncbi:MAG: hypothetical protein K9N47_26510 [Prosthecobacter sp.]|uniref:hypothetical protein n=1 Tax=Prosthecobacter sp. TaxID=1965333 RepID=UPI00263202BA|nr:hypothetical protein [Prosthecobacter sp.]MCF7789705.1 hypothetical protein [Prosthecobacter sp.]